MTPSLTERATVTYPASSVAAWRAKAITMQDENWHSVRSRRWPDFRPSGAA